MNDLTKPEVSTLPGYDDMCFLNTVLSLGEIQVGDLCVLRSKHPMNLQGEFIFKGNYKAIAKEETGAKLWPFKITFKHIDTGKKYSLMNMSDGYYEVSSKYINSKEVPQNDRLPGDRGILLK